MLSILTDPDCLLWSAIALPLLVVALAMLALVAMSLVEDRRLRRGTQPLQAIDQAIKHAQTTVRVTPATVPMRKLRAVDSVDDMYDDLGGES